ncbi:hypothetical protein FNV43_RR17495 [Rhamnella rubrinervis]|uniref:Cyanobacterial aminoacyl-tRNA synthetase CAAD domain-containing protein n=1 Tax=Rhamnella rubrinervis TaxID=2594499 RepID=A0A8K0DXM4_9ROSA|nr:hypothetical protein FNV43_RR17495 [Rhamnella rubrinervis]
MEMALFTAQAISNLPTTNHKLLIPNTSHLSPKPSLLPSRTSPSGSSRHLHSRLLYFSNSLPRAATSEETSSGANQYNGKDRDGVVTFDDSETKDFNERFTAEAPREESIVDGQTQTFELLNNLNVRNRVKSLEFALYVTELIDSNDTYKILFYGGGALVTVWFASAIVGSIDSIPIFPKLMEVVGLGYTVWFTSRYLIFKKRREELVAKLQELKQQVLGSDD